MTSTTTTDLPMLIEEVECVAVERLTPSFVRVELSSPALAELGIDPRSYDQRIKLIFPEPGHPLPVSLHPVHADDPPPDQTDPDRAAPAAVTARLVKRRRRRDERGEAS